MKISRIITVLLIITILSCGGLIIFRSALAANPSTSQTTDTAKTALPSVKVTLATASTDSTSWLELLGAVKANDQIKVFATGAGQLQQVFASEGSLVKTGDPLFIIGGLNGTKPAALVQLETAQKNYVTAQNGLQLTNAGNDEALRVAELQLDSAKHQTEGSYVDLQVFDRNMDAARASLYYLQNSYDTSGQKNELDIEKTQKGIDDLKQSINDLENQKYSLEKQIEEQGTSADATGQSGVSSSGGQQTATDLPTQLAALNKTLEGLYSQLDTAKTGYQELLQGQAIANNQLLGQIAQAQTGENVLSLNQQSMGKKLGLDNGSSDPVKLAQEGLNAAKVKNQASLLQSQAQLDLARSNLELAQLQADALIVRAPIDGAVGEVLAHSGDLVSQQSMLTQISGQKDYELRVGVDADSAESVTAGSQAQVEIGGKYMNVPIKNIGTAADPVTRLVNVTVALPRINFRANQTLRVKIPLNNAGRDLNTLFIPLDAVIVGTEEQYVFVDQNGVAIKKNVKTGEVRGDQVQILDGLASSDQVVVDGAKTLVEGQNIET